MAWNTQPGINSLSKITGCFHLEVTFKLSMIVCTFVRLMRQNFPWLILIDAIIWNAPTNTSNLATLVIKVGPSIKRCTCFKSFVSSFIKGFYHIEFLERLGYWCLGLDSETLVDSDVCDLWAYIVFVDKTCWEKISYNFGSRWATHLNRKRESELMVGRSECFLEFYSFKSSFSCYVSVKTSHNHIYI